MAHPVMTIVGARPQMIKAAAVSRALGQAGDLREVLVHTGQHFDANMSDVFFDDLEIPAPAHYLDVSGGAHGAMTGRMLERLEEVMVSEKPAAVIVYGDTNSTLAGALAAAKLHIPVLHVEAGLRSFNKRMPEEINRIVADHVSSLLLCPTRVAVANLAREGITSGVHWVGDVMFDVIVDVRSKALTRSSVLERLGLKDKEYGVCTVHRAENADDAQRFGKVIAYLSREAERLPLVFPVHPRIRRRVADLAQRSRRITFIDPLGYLDMCRLMAGARIVLTDSGGMQKEAYFHRVPCVTLRDETEWVETVESGWNRLWTSPDYAPRRDIPDYGDGNASGRIVDLVRAFLAA